MIDAKCTHCGAQLGSNRADCWWCDQAFAEDFRAQVVDRDTRHIAVDQSPAVLRRFLNQYGVFFPSIRN